MTTPAIALAGSPAALPAAVPAWITPQLIDLTLRVWQPFYHVQLAAQDAVQILLNAGRLFSVLARTERKMTHTGEHYLEQTICSTRQSQQP